MGTYRQVTAIACDGFRTDICSELSVENADRGGVVSERRVNPCGEWPRPTGRDCILLLPGHDVLANKLLASLPYDDFQVLKAQLVIGNFPQGTLLFDVDDEIDQIYFPLSGMISLLVVLQNGNCIETATVGREGVVGAMAGLDLHKSQVKGVTQLDSTVARISAAQLRKAVAERPAIAKLCIRYNEVLLAQARIIAACNLSHTVEARLCRWLLETRDRVEGDTIRLTQEFLSEMLGVRRTSVTEVAVKLQNAGMIRYSRGVIHITALQKLRETSCECYETLRREAPR